MPLPWLDIRVPAPRYLPFDDRPWRHRIGARPLPLERWLEPDELRETELALKQRLLAEHHDKVVVALDDTEAAADEVLRALRVFLERYGLNTPAPHDDPALHPIDAAGRLTQDDLCLLLPDPVTGRLVLAAASLCFPNRWRLHDKLGRPLLDTHAPVPGYAAQISAATDALLARLQPDAPVWRANWGVVVRPDLFQPTTHDDAGPIELVTPDNAGETTYLRVERQSLRRFPEHGSVLFTIRTYVHRLDKVALVPGAAARLASAINGLPPEFLAYKSLDVIGPPVTTWLRAHGHHRGSAMG